jgi:2-polyprenyl-6-methoxyphenol hydroxylase-like FAD-dependent oxidoreductase
VKALLLQLFCGWNQHLQALIVCADTQYIWRPMYALPVGLRWRNNPGVPLLGDAAHLMSPFAGEGANLAMLDAAELGAAIARGGDIGAEIAAYEAGMFSRSRGAAAESASNLFECFKVGSPQSKIDTMSRHSAASLALQR